MTDPRMVNPFGGYREREAELLGPFLDRELHVDIYELGVCADGTLTVEGGWLRFSAIPELCVPIDQLRAIAVEPDFGPREYTDMPDLAVFISEPELFIQAWKVLRAPELHDAVICDLLTVEVQIDDDEPEVRV